MMREFRHLLFAFYASTLSSFPAVAGDNQIVAKLSIAASRGDARAQCKLGMIYLGHIVKDSLESIKNKNALEATKWLRQAAEQGYAPAEFHLGQVLTSDLRNYDPEAVKWFRKAAEDGIVNAMVLLSVIYTDAGNYEEARKWNEEAARSGSIPAYIGLGFLELKSPYGDTTLDKAMKQAAYYQHNSLATYNLNNAINKFNVHAFIWFDLAAQQEVKTSRSANWHNLAVAYRDSVAKEMSLAQLTEAKHLEKEWQAEHPVLSPMKGSANQDCY